ncbi:glutaminase [Thermomonas sp.]|uniref:glutaminase n=1 Tax=Thermomonas sp. TaxID=1971895 RepID=UPI00248A5E12|nr:glutaminase [Thermomonas sp.]MDI1253024.1 glutaminase [Thermomonas sp.]
MKSPRLARQRASCEHACDEYFDSEHGIPCNPLINAGAHVIADVVLSQYPDALDRLLAFVRERAGNNGIDMDQEVARSERDTGFRNAALANFIKAVISPDRAKRINALMLTCGTYDAAGGVCVPRWPARQERRGRRHWIALRQSPGCRSSEVRQWDGRNSRTTRPLPATKHLRSCPIFRFL